MRRRGHAVAAGGVAPPAALVALGLVVGSVAISFSPILVRVAHVPALALAFWRCLAGALLLAPFAMRSVVDRRAWASWREAGWLAVSGGCLALHFALWNASLALTTVASSTVLVACSPLFVGLAAGPLLGEPPSRQGWVGIGLTIAGATLIALGDAGAVDLGEHALLGDAMAFAGAAAIGAYFLIGRSARRRLPATTYAASVYGVAAAVLLPACLLTGARLSGYPGGSWLAIGGVVAGPQLLGHTVFNALLATLTADVVAVVTLTEPVGATVLAWLLFDELPTPWFWPGAALVLAGVWLAGRAGRRAARPAASPGV
ncbi:MAG TPA: DMT family transporter [Actinomycetes bacterium]|jgi:drug/metabolite transporter (DMT)-like permease|nr:DMT family transporter [Actinomycetes bacterium]